MNGLGWTRYLVAVGVLVLGAGMARAEEVSEPVPPVQGPLRAIDAVPFDEGLNRQADVLLEKAGLRLFADAIVTSLRVEYQPVEAPATAPREDASAYLPDIAPSQPVETQGQRLRLIDVTVAASQEPADLQLFFDRQVPDARLWLKQGKRRTTMLLRNKQDSEKGEAQKDIQVLIRQERPTGDDREQWRERLELLRWRHLMQWKEWVLEQVQGAQEAAMRQALLPVEEKQNDLMFQAKGRWRSFRPTDLDPRDMAELRAAYLAVFEQFAPGPMPEDGRLRAERLEMVGLRTALAEYVFVRIRVELPAREQE